MMRTERVVEWVIIIVLWALVFALVGWKVFAAFIAAAMAHNMERHAITHRS